MKLPNEEDFQQVNTKLDYLGVKGIERDETWKQNYRDLKNMIALIAWQIIITWIGIGVYFAVR